MFEVELDCCLHPSFNYDDVVFLYGGTIVLLEVGIANKNVRPFDLNAAFSRLKSSSATASYQYFVLDGVKGFKKSNISSSFPISSGLGIIGSVIPVPQDFVIVRISLCQGTDFGEQSNCIGDGLFVRAARLKITKC